MTRSQATPISSQMMTMERMISERDDALATAAAQIACLNAVCDRHVIDNAKLQEQIAKLEAELTRLAGCTFPTTVEIAVIKIGQEKHATSVAIRNQIAKLEAERDEWKDSAINGGNANYLRERIAKLEGKLTTYENGLKPIKTLLLFSDAQLHTDEDLVFHFRNQIRLALEQIDAAMKLSPGDTD